MSKNTQKFKDSQEKAPPLSP
ncbi:hypothetical protein CY0110_19617 [Crocosphaera chwakensis CCY0110]|uniref:Uncharacterized protein n=1 Tax=Crocosphaera chwakensis CCY0110 TaxID=391612 RepID=A3IJQ5_9CHRO|nr:hypothetical protein CY0110_19617 [Crocosphaera chwakensis CCY0110]